MKKQTRRAVAELCGAVVGAGFASGREIAAFFTRFGPWSWAGVAAAGMVIGWLCQGLLRSPGVAGMPANWQGDWRGWLWRGMFTALLVATGGAMLAGGAEIAALMLPLRWARAIGLAVTMLLGWQLADKGGGRLTDVSRGLIICLVGVVVAGLFLPMRRAVSVAAHGGAEGVLLGLCYGGFNASLAAPVISAWGSRMPDKEKRKCAFALTAVLTALLACGNAVLVKHTALQDEQLPFVMLLAPWGKWGYMLAAGALYLAALTTLTACMKGVSAMLGNWMPLAVTVMALLSLGGLEEIVGVAYPVLGGGCFLLLLWARISNGTKT